TLVSVTVSAGAPMVVSLAAAPDFPRLASESNGAHSRSCAGSVSAAQTFSGEWRSSRTTTSVHFSPSLSMCAPAAGPGVYCSRFIICFSSAFFSLELVHPCDRDGVRVRPDDGTRNGGTAPARPPLPERAPASGGRGGAARPL